MPKYEEVRKEIADQIERAKREHCYPGTAFPDSGAIRRRDVVRDRGSVWRPTFVHDVDKIMHCPYYNRYSDKTQVFSLTKNDDITRRALHVQLVSRISRTIGAALHLNLDLIEAISLGHDIGHTPFGHTGERYLDELYNSHTGRHFYHNIHSVRVLDGIFPYNISLQTLNGIAAHNGEIEVEEYHPVPLKSFEEFDRIIEKCYCDPAAAIELMPCTLEGSVVRLADIIAYLGKDRQDAIIRAKLADESMFMDEEIGSINSEIINNLVVNVIETSYGKPYIGLDAKHFKSLSKSKMDNYARIYNRAAAMAHLDTTVKPMMVEIYGQMLDDLKNGVKSSPIFTHHIDYVNAVYYKKRKVPYENSEPNQIVVDYIASMTDNYFIELHNYLFPGSDLKVEYAGYFDEELRRREENKND